MAWTLYEGDCLEIMRQMERESVDAVITDPPYSSGGMFRGDKAKPPEQKYVNPVEVVNFHPTFTGDTMDQRAFFAWSVHWWTLARRLLKPGGFAAVFTDWRQLPITSDAFQAGGLIWRGVVVWDKGPAARPFPGRFRQQTEFIIWGSNGAMPGPGKSDFSRRSNKSVALPREATYRRKAYSGYGASDVNPAEGSGDLGSFCRERHNLTCG